MEITMDLIDSFVEIFRGIFCLSLKYEHVLFLKLQNQGILDYLSIFEIKRRERNDLILR